MYSGGLCDAVIMAPAFAFSSPVAKASVGVVANPMRNTLQPTLMRPEVRANSTGSAAVLISLATTTVPPFT
ncbi:MAG: hypothetical protein RBG13Loki_2500 [Promethearchaeota archaeon CR_4]|nr:MAG: hypothetical protein RBG13Loki_2500 [Candidatus Lokiarchaeota archaeon CR_4]